nr:response regulator [Saccharibacillus sp. WB 17]
MYIEDDSYNMLVVRHLFRKKLPQLKLLESATVEAGLECASRERPCLILMDLKFIGMDGYEGLTELRRRPETRHIPVWAVSASVMDDEIERAKEAGFDAYISKPIEMKTFVERLQAYVDSLPSL